MDFTQFEVEDVIEHTIVDRNGSATAVVFLLAGPGHPARVDLDRKLSKRSLRQFNKTGKASLPDDPDELREQETERMVALTLDWRGVTDKAGEPVPYTPEAAREAFENRRSSVRAQVARALADIANFTVGSSSN
jgi:hypothetical protein